MTQHRRRRLDAELGTDASRDGVPQLIGMPVRDLLLRAGSRDATRVRGRTVLIRWNAARVFLSVGAGGVAVVKGVLRALARFSRISCIESDGRNK